ncbi:hypothetical protein [Gordonibacter sp. An230]|uniref:hypothetical protein n=1 Tax=Gordonibacter sp. An230 TaxID=1965592 RepID=UPI00111F32F1|nr:hypothetical protein [Gordonibacter sp. An230]
MGKALLVRWFAREGCGTLLEFGLVETSGANAIFEGGFDAEASIMGLSVLGGVSFRSGGVLAFFGEI